MHGKLKQHNEGSEKEEKAIMTWLGEEREDGDERIPCACCPTRGRKRKCLMLDFNRLKEGIFFKF